MKGDFMETYTFDAKEMKERCVAWIREWFEKNGPSCKAVLGISGGKDSSVAAALCVEALGKERVIGVLLPSGIQEDIDYAKELVEHLDIKSMEINIGDSVEVIYREMELAAKKDCHWSAFSITPQTKTNLPARIRMSVIYAVAQSVNGMMVNTCNLSESHIGYSTLYGDQAGSFSPLDRLTATEVKAIGRELKVPDRLVQKAPSDGLCGKTDEDNLGFTYAELDQYIRTGEIGDLEHKKKIDDLYRRNHFKTQIMHIPTFEAGLPYHTGE